MTELHLTDYEKELLAQIGQLNNQLQMKDSHIAQYKVIVSALTQQRNRAEFTSAQLRIDRDEAQARVEKLSKLWS